MKHEVRQLSVPKVAQEYPLSGLVEGWYFKIEETSAGVYRVEGTDLRGRRVSYTGVDLEDLLLKCKEYAESVTS